MKKILLAFLMLIAFSFTVFAQDTVDQWILEINGQKYYYSDLIAKYNTYVEITVPPDKQSEYKNNKQLLKAFLENYINEILIMNKLGSENFINNNKNLLMYQRKQIIVQLYIQKIIFPTIPEPTQKEIEDYYNKNAKNYQNVDIETAMNQIKEVLKNMKLQEKMNEILQEKKESMIIKRNPDYFEKQLKTDWVLKIGDETIDYDTFNSLFIDFLNQVPEAQREKAKYLLLKQFTESYINTYLFYQEIKGSNFEQQYDKQIKYMFDRTVIEFYIKTKLQGQFQAVTQAEVDTYYNMNKSQFASYPEAQAKQYIYNMLNNQLFDMLIKDYIQTIRDESIIKRNKTFLQSIGIG